MPEPTVLIADDDAQIRELLTLYFRKEGFTVATAADGAETIIKVQQLNPNLLILDLMMPVLDGLEACRQIRKFSAVPIIMLTALSDDEERITGLDSGADDYVGKPFNPREVVARGKAVLRRQTAAKQQPENREVLRFSELEINLGEYRATVGGKEVSLTAKEMELLWHMASHAGRVFSREQLLESVWGYSYCGDTRTVDTHIKRIRQKLSAEENNQWDIKTVWGVGYKFEVKS
ncbi:MAG: two component transcriptional regulator, winged helix family [Firmicutes bacterium]|nr:two component transcriptional regulator, winged helix family [Bacillota bacterium]